MELFIVTGMSGAGKTVVLKTLEDAGYYCVDNLPVFLIPQFADLCNQNREIDRFAVGIDTRSGNDLNLVPGMLEELRNKGICYKVIFLDASDAVLIKRYKETRRSHPLARTGRIEDGISLEREQLLMLKKNSDILLDTTSFLVKDLKEQVLSILSGEFAHFKNLVITIMSFGFKYGIPMDSDLVLDVRFLPNPYYEEDLKELTGLKEEVSSYVLKNAVGEEFINKTKDLLEFLIPNYIKEGKNQLLIAVGCTGGKHRSVAVAEEIRKQISGNEDYVTKIIHRDITR